MSGGVHPGSAAEAMDGIYRRQRFVYDATRRYYLLGRDRLIADLGVPAGGTVLEIGCGTARNLLRAARRHPEARRLYGLDVSEAMLKTARGSVARHGCASRIKRLQRAWLRRFPVVPIPDLESGINVLADQAGCIATSIRLYGGFAIQARLERR